MGLQHLSLLACESPDEAKDNFRKFTAPIEPQNRPPSEIKLRRNPTVSLNL
jgi:hypothetical protein